MTKTQPTTDRAGHTLTAEPRLTTYGFVLVLGGYPAAGEFDLVDRVVAAAVDRLAPEPVVADYATLLSKGRRLRAQRDSLAAEVEGLETQLRDNDDDDADRFIATHKKATDLRASRAAVDDWLDGTDARPSFERKLYDARASVHPLASRVVASVVKEFLADAEAAIGTTLQQLLDRPLGSAAAEVSRLADAIATRDVIRVGPCNTGAPGVGEAALARVMNKLTPAR